MNWRDYIVSEAEVLGGKPLLKGTRLSVEFILGLFAMGWKGQTILENYPSLNQESIQAVFSYAQDSLKEGPVFEVTQ
ncbi:MAG: DUF433 domain-containing protein [Cyclobacteriaceae bacterium]|jgi:uncharacterized protein (DUF433 family)|nr:DUF433 domain-containing protein [Cyclobacteriaceae bacterium]